MAQYRRRPDADERMRHLLDILQCLPRQSSGRQVTVNSLMRETGISKTTLYRELHFLESCDYITWEQGKGIAAKEHPFFVPNKGFTPEEILTLAVVLPMLETQGFEGAAGVIEKMISGLPVALQALVDQARGAIIASPASRQQQEEQFLVQLLGAIRQRQTIRLDYDSAQSGRRFRRFDPYAVNLSAPKIELQGWCHEKQQFITLLLRRIEAVELKPDRFPTRDADWAAFRRQSGVVRGLRGGEPIPVKIRFSPTVTRYVNETTWPEGLKCHPLPNGGVCVAGTVQGVEGILVEVLRWRRHATVEEGEKLRAALQEELKAIQANYGWE